MRLKIDVVVRFYKAYLAYKFTIHEADLGIRYFYDDFNTCLRKKTLYVELIPSLAREL